MHTEELTQVESAVATTDTQATTPAKPADTIDTTQLSPAALSLLAAALLAACGGGGGGDATGGNGPLGTTPSGTGSVTPTPPPVEVPVAAAPNFNNFPKAATDEEAARFLLQNQLDASDAEIAAVKSGTYAYYLQQQFAKPVGPTGWQWLEDRGYGAAPTTFNFFFNTYPADFMLWNQLFTSPDGMRKRIALALSEVFVASLQSAEFTWRSHGFAQYWDMLNANAFGNFRKLLEDVTLSPAMGYYLNTKGNQKEDNKGRVPDENYAREVMQLFTIGLYKLNLDGTEQTDGSGKKLESYTQDDVTNLARVFTGYDFDTSDGVKVQVLRQDGSAESYTVESKAFTQKPMALNATRHSNLEAKFLGATVPANTPGAAALKTALDTLFNHPNVAPFFAKQMIQRLVTSNPSTKYVERVAAAFNNNGSGVRGDLQAVWVAILLDDEARSPASLVSPTFGKLREPMLRFIQWGRSFGLTSQGNSWKIFDTADAANQLGQSPFRSPSVFNFFRPGFVPPGTELAKTQTPAPEFQLVNETTVGGYLNFLQDRIRYGLYTGNVNVPQLTNGEAYTPTIAATYTKELALVADAATLVNRLNLVLCAGQMSATTKTTIITAINTKALPPTTAKPEDIQNAKLDRIAAAVLLTMACPEYLVQK
jgi:uncharacterized protein (DUF1800 family)